MTTTTSTTSSTTTAITTATQQLLTSLDTGSGVDTTSLVTSLVAAEFASRTDALTTKNTALTAQLSGVSTLKSTITEFSAALDSLSTGGSLTTQPVSSDTSVLSATATAGAKLAGLSRSITVTRLAAAQTAQTTATDVTDRTLKQFSGSLTITTGAATVNADGSVSQSGGTAKTIAVTGGSLDDVARQINLSGTGVTASVVTDANGTAYLSMKGKTGAANGFTVTTSDSGSGSHSLSMFDVGDAGGAKASGQAVDAALTVDGIAVTRASNTVTDLVDGASITLAKVGSVQLTSTTPTDALSQAVSNFVETYNQVLSTVTGLTDAQTGALRTDPAAKALQRGLQKLAATVLLPDGASGTPRSLSEIGVGTNRDGTLKVDSTALASAIAANPQAVEAMFAAPTTTTTGSTSTTAMTGLVAVLDALSTTAIGTTTVSGLKTGLTGSEATYTVQQTKVADDQSDLTTKSASETTRLTQQFATMNSKVAAYKSTQTFLTNQIAAWNKSDD